MVGRQGGREVVLSLGLSQPSCEITVGWCLGEVRTQMSVFVAAYLGRTNICFSLRMQFAFLVLFLANMGGKGDIGSSIYNSLGHQARDLGTLLM